MTTTESHRDETTPVKVKPDEVDTDETGEDEEDEASVMSHLTSFARELFVVVVGAIIVSTLIRMFVGQMFMIPSASMESTLLIGDRVVAQKVTDLQRGDVVVFGDPGGWLGKAPPERGQVGKALQFIGVLPDTSRGDLIKRVIGMPGDKVVCCDKAGKITVNGRALDETSYLSKDAAGQQAAPSEVKFQVIVPKDRVFVMGDHRDESADSRCHLSDVYKTEKKGAVAFVPIDLVVGPAMGIVAPFNRAGLMHRPDTFAAVPAAAQPAPDVAVIKPANVTC